MWVYRVNSDELMHHGIKGQKWGVRRTAAQLGHKASTWVKKKLGIKDDDSATSKKKTSSKSDSNESSKTKSSKTKPSNSWRKKSVKNMTDEELATATKRLEAEKKYNELKIATSSSSKGQSYVNKIVSDIGKNSLTNVGTQASNSGLTYAANKALKAMTDSQVKSKNWTQEYADQLFNDLKFYTNNKKGK